MDSISYGNIILCGNCNLGMLLTDLCPNGCILRIHFDECMAHKVSSLGRSALLDVLRVSYSVLTLHYDQYPVTDLSDHETSSQCTSFIAYNIDLSSDIATSFSYRDVRALQKYADVMCGTLLYFDKLSYLSSNSLK